jgi:hypothetical protein
VLRLLSLSVLRVLVAQSHPFSRLVAMHLLATAPLQPGSAAGQGGPGGSPAPSLGPRASHALHAAGAASADGPKSSAALVAAALAVAVANGAAGIAQVDFALFAPPVTREAVAAKLKDFESVLAVQLAASSGAGAPKPTPAAMAALNATNAAVAALMAADPTRTLQLLPLLPEVPALLSDAESVSFACVTQLFAQYLEQAACLVLQHQQQQQLQRAKSLDRQGSRNAPQAPAPRPSPVHGAILASSLAGFHATQTGFLCSACSMRGFAGAAAVRPRDWRSGRHDVAPRARPSHWRAVLARHGGCFVLVFRDCTGG